MNSIGLACKPAIQKNLCRYGAVLAKTDLRRARPMQVLNPKCYSLAREQILGAQMIRYTGSCHCGAVKFTFSAPEIEQAMRCDCSICARKGMSMSITTIAPEDIEISTEEDVLSTYQFGSMTARHHFCSQCGIHTFVETRLNPGHYRINLGCVDGINAPRLPEIIYDGQALD